MTCQVSYTQQVVQVQSATPVLNVTVAARGPTGRPGAGGGAVTYIQDSAPLTAIEQETWWNPLTLQLKVWHDFAWQPVAPDGGYF